MDNAMRGSASWVLLAGVLGLSPVACGTSDNPGGDTSSSSGSSGTGSSGGSSGTGSGSSSGAGSSSGTASSGSGSGSSSGGSSGASSSGSTSGGSSGGTSGGSSGSSSGSTSGGPYTGIQVSGTKFVDSSGAEFIPRGISPGEWHNIESYMLDLSLANDSPGMGMTSLRNALTKANAADFFPTWYANVVTADDVAEWASWGTKNHMNTVRLPMNYHDLSSADGVYIDAGFQVMDQFIGWCKAHNIYVILDMHAAPGAQNCEEMSDTMDGVAHLWSEPTKYRQWTIDLWQHIAQRYANEPFVMGFDLFDEPYSDENNGDFGSSIDTLNSMYQDLIKAIRAVSPHQIIIMEGTLWSSGSDFVKGLESAIQSDPQTAMSFHEYMNFKDVPMNQSTLQQYLSARTNLGRPVWHGEYGEASAASLAGTVQIDEKNGVGWNVWTYKKVGQGSCAYEVKEPSNYSAMQTYLNGKGAGTPPSDANTIMQALAANAATKSCTSVSGWVQAMFP